jgi:plasmid maintenance system antidote protein VapI
MVKELTKEEYENGMKLLIRNTADVFWVNEEEVKEFVENRNKVIDKENKNISYLERVLDLRKSLSIHFSLLDIKNKRDDEYDDW